MFFDKLISAFAGALISELIKNCSGILRTILLGEVEGIITQTIVKVTVFSSSFIILLKYVLFSSKPLRNYPFLGEVVSLRARLKTRGNMILVQSDGTHPKNHLSTTREFLSLLSTNSTHNEWKRSTIEA